MSDLTAALEDLGAGYPLIAYAGPAGESDDEESPLDPMILAGIASP